MTTKPVALGDWRRPTTVLLALVAVAVVTTAAVPAPARAAAKHTAELAQGVGMGDKPSAAVRHVQRVLRSRGYSLGRPGVDGRFGPLTAAAVRRLQADSGLIADGIVGPKTRNVVRRIERRSQRSSSTRRSGSRTKAPTPSRVTTPQTAPPTAARAQGNDAGWLVAIALAAATAAFCAAVAISLRRPGRRHGDGAAVTPLAHDPYREGRIAVAPGGDVDHGEAQYPSGLAGEPVIGYVTVSPEPEPDRHEARAGVHEIEEACERAMWVLAEVVSDRESGRGLERPGLAYALQQIAEGKARGLVVGDLRRLTRSIVDLGALMKWFRDAQAGLVALDLGVDTSTPAGREVAATLITLGDWERERIARRTRSGLAEVRASGRPTGRPAVSDQPELVARITMMRGANMTLQAIADQLNAEGVPTLRGGAMWRPSSVQAALGYRRPGTRGPRDHFPTLEDRV